MLAYDSEDDLVADLQAPPALRHRHRHTAGLAAGTHIVYGSLPNLSIRCASSSSSLSFIDTGRRLHNSFVHRLHHSRPLGPAVLAAPDRPPTADAATTRSLRTAALPKSFVGTLTACKVLAGVSLLALAALGCS